MSLGKSVLGVFATNVLNLFFSFGNSIVVTRLLGVSGRGEFAVFSASFGILSLLLGLGVDISLQYHIAKGQIPRERILASLLAYVGGVGPLLFAVLHLNHALFHNELFLPYSQQTLAAELALVGVVVSNLIFGNIASVFAGTRSFRTLNVASLAFGGMSLVVFTVLLWVKASGWREIGLEQVLPVFLGTQIFNACVLTGLAYRELGVRLCLQFLDKKVVLDMLRYASLAYAASLLQYLNYRLDIWLVQYFCGSHALGLYSLAANLAMMLWMLPKATSSVLMPTMASGGTGTDFPAVARLGRLLVAGACILALPLALLARWWIGVLYGFEFTGAARPFVILLAGCVVFTLCIVQAAALGARARLAVHLWASGAGLVVTVVLALVLIPRHGIDGAAAASAASYVVTTGVVLLAFSRLGKISLRSCVLPQRSDLGYVIYGLKNLLR